MKYILNPSVEGIHFETYRTHLETIRHRMPAHVYAFAADFQHFDLFSHSTLHDAWLESITIEEIATGTRHEVRRLEIRLRLLGAFHDRHIHLRYEGVTSYSNAMPARHGDSRYEHTSHGDLFTHEVLVNDAGMLTHELLFERDSTLFIECANITHWETPIV